MHALITLLAESGLDAWRQGDRPAATAALNSAMSAAQQVASAEHAPLTRLRELIEAEE